MMVKRERKFMPTVTGRNYPTSWRGKPPHMLQPDIPIWYEYLSKNKDHFVELYYDCLLGGPAFTPLGYNEKLRNMWKYIGSKRADAIALTIDEVWIIEVTSESKIKALGQLLLYKRLWLNDPKSPLPVKMILVCDFVDSDVIAAAKAYGIQVSVVDGGETSTKAA